MCQRLFTHFCFCYNTIVLATQSCPTPLDPIDCSPPGSSVHGSSLDWDCPSLLQGIFPNPGLPHCRQILYHLSHKGSQLGPTMPLNTMMRCPIAPFWGWKITTGYKLVKLTCQPILKNSSKQMSLDPLEAMEWCYSENFWEFLRRLLRVDLQFQVSFGKKKTNQTSIFWWLGMTFLTTATISK